MTFNLKHILASLAAVACVFTSTPAIAKTYAEKAQELGQKLDDAEKLAKEEAEKAKKKAEEAAALLKKKAEELSTELKEIAEEGAKDAKELQQATENKEPKA